MINLFNLKPRPTGTLTAFQERDVAQLVQAGREIEAVRQIRRWTNTSLQGAVAIVSDLRPHLELSSGD